MQLHIGQSLFPWLLVDEISRWTCAGTDSGIFEDDQVTHVEGDVDPVRDMEIIHEELRLKDLEYLDRTVDHMERVVVRGGDKSRKAEYVNYQLSHILSCNHVSFLPLFVWTVVLILSLLL